jgi:hypothetical protein
LEKPDFVDRVAIEDEKPFEVTGESGDVNGEQPGEKLLSLLRA